MNNSQITIQQRTENFAVRVIKAYCQLKTRSFDDAGNILAKQFLRSGTSIGANCAEAFYAQSTKDYISKYSIALKEASETQYWIKIMMGLLAMKHSQICIPTLMKKLMVMYHC